MAGRRVHFVFPSELVERIDAACPEGVSRGEFVRRAVEAQLDSPVARAAAALADATIVSKVPARMDAEQALSEAKEPLTKERADPGSVSSSEGVRSAAPAERPSDAEAEPMDFSAVPAMTRIAASAQAKRDVRPIPKKGER